MTLNTIMTGLLPAPIEACWTGAGAARKLAKFARDLGARSCLLLFDSNTRFAAERLEEALADERVRVDVHNLGGGHIPASAGLAAEAAAIARGHGLIAAAGSGTISDLAKYAGSQLDKPVLLYPTAPSMNGYTSAIAALEQHGLKRTLPCTPAAGVFADPEVVATAPARMRAAGLADFLSKCSAACDWRVANLLRGEYYSAEAMKYYEGTVEQVLEAAPGVAQGEPEAVDTLLRALLLSGLSMLVAGSSSPASGGEHLISHYLDMKCALYGLPHDLHGAQVGVATLHCLELWQRVLELTPNQIDPVHAAEAQPSEAEIAAAIEADWGEAVAAEVREQWAKKRLDSRELQGELERFRANLPEIQRAVRTDYLPPDTIRTAVRQAGGPVTPNALEAPIVEYYNAIERARYIRNRFTVLDLAAELAFDA